MSTKTKLFKIILPVVAVVFLIVGYLYLTGKMKLNNESVEIEEIAETTQENETTETENADWKTYRNEEYEFEFMYPEIWKIQEYKFKSGNDVVYIGLDPSRTVSQEDFGKADIPVGLITIKLKESNSNSINKETYEKLETVEIAKGVVVKKLEIKTGENEPNPGYNRKHLISYYLGDKIVYGDFFINDIEIRYVSNLDDQYLKSFNQILSTFKFTE